MEKSSDNKWIALFFVFFVFLLLPLAAKGETLKVYQVNGNYFTSSTGKAVYLTGLHTWSNLQDMNGFPGMGTVNGSGARVAPYSSQLHCRYGRISAALSQFQAEAFLSSP